MNDEFQLKPIGAVRSSIASRKDAPKQGHEGAPEAWVDIYPEFTPALDGLEAGMDVILLTWLHQSRRETLKVHPRGDISNPERGVFITRSPDRPNPIGLHPVRIVEIDPARGLRVSPLEAIDGTPVVDIKPTSC